MGVDPLLLLAVRHLVMNASVRIIRVVVVDWGVYWGLHSWKLTNLRFLTTSFSRFQSLILASIVEGLAFNIFLASALSFPQQFFEREKHL